MKQPPATLATSKAEELESLLPPETTADILDIEPKTLRKWRSEGRGPDYIKVGSLVKYAPEAVRRYVKARTVKLAG